MNQIQVLLVEDDSSDAWLLQHRLQEAMPRRYEISHVTSVESAIPLMRKQRFDVALLDLSLPGISGMNALRQMQMSNPELPVVVVTSTNDERLALHAVQQGAQDYLVKGKGNGMTIKRIMHYAIERKRFEETLIRLANFDALTGLTNRRFFENRLEMALARARRNNLLIGLLFIDLNDFKLVNDGSGHDAGDTVLVEVAHRMQTVFREYDTVARFGGDEFAVLLDGIAQSEDCTIAAQKTIDILADPVPVGGNDVSVGVSIGIATASPRDRMTPSELVRRADTAMYVAKESGGSTYRCFDASMTKDTKVSA